MKPMQAAEVAPVNWKASQILGMKLAPRKTTEMSPIVRKPNLKLSVIRGGEDGKSNPSRFRRRGKKMTGKTSIR